VVWGGTVPWDAPSATPEAGRAGRYGGPLGPASPGHHVPAAATFQDRRRPGMRN